jgi:hypothetical protein
MSNARVYQLLEYFVVYFDFVYGGIFAEMAEIEVNDVSRPLPTISRVLFNFRFSASFPKNGKWYAF